MIDWKNIFKALEKWRENLNVKDPSVTTVAEYYKQSEALQSAALQSAGLNVPWVVLVSTILSLRTKDEVTLAASKRLLEKAGTPAELNAKKTETIEKLIYPVGFYRNKAASLKKIASILIKKYDSKVPDSMEELLDLPGVGRKTANLVLTEAFDIDALCVDIHVHRISNRCGWLSSKTPEETEMILRDILPKKYWKRINYLLVLYGQKLCRSVSPFCSQCVIVKHCARCTVDRSR